MNHPPSFAILVVVEMISESVTGEPGGFCRTSGRQ